MLKNRFKRDREQLGYYTKLLWPFLRERWWVVLALIGIFVWLLVLLDRALSLGFFVGFVLGINWAKPLKHPPDSPTGPERKRAV